MQRLNAVVPMAGSIRNLHSRVGVHPATDEAQLRLIHSIYRCQGSDNLAEESRDTLARET